jgi:hypothetical protein
MLFGTIFGSLSLPRARILHVLNPPLVIGLQHGI